MKCFYHSADLDGHCSGAIVKYFCPECEMIGINYGDPFPWDIIQPSELIVMVDFSLQPFDEMEELLRRYPGLIWIDHHKTAIDEAEKRGFDPLGLRRVGDGACLLTWEAFTTVTDKPKLLPPLAVQYLSAYDVWLHSDPHVVYFQYGFRMHEDTRPDNQALWEEYLQADKDARIIDVTVAKGLVVLEYEDQQNAKVCRAYAFPTTISPNVLNPDRTYRAICCNRGMTNSKLFDSVWDPEQSDVMITFCRLKPPAGKWTISLYSTKDDVDCGAIAKTFGGGGHKGAAGFRCVTLPFGI